jgi:hypothetical protein
LLVMAALFAMPAAALPLNSYLKLSSADKPEGQAGFALHEGGVNVRADLRMRAEGGRPKAVPKVKSSFDVGDALNVETDLSLPAWGEGGASGTASDTKILLRTLPPFIDRLEGRVRRSAGGKSKESLRLGFADVLDDARVLGGGRMNVKAALTVDARGEQAAVLPEVTSAVALGNAFDMVTKVCVEEWTGAGSDCRSRFDTQFLVHRLPAFVDALEARIRRSIDGVFSRSLKFGFSETFGEARIGRAPFSIQGKAILEQMARPDTPDAFHVGFETVFAGFMPPVLPGSDKLSLRVERRSGTGSRRIASLAYDHSWTAVRDLAEVGFKLKLLSAAGGVEPSLGVTWDAHFRE